MATQLQTKWIKDRAVTIAKLGTVTGNGLSGGDGTNNITVLADGTTLSVGGSGVKVTDGGISSLQLAAKSVSAAKLGDDIDGNGLTGGDGAALAVLADGTGLTVSAAGVKITAGGVDAAMLAGSIPDSKLLQITTTNKVAASAVEDKFLRNDADDTCAGRIMANGFDANSQIISRVADAVANSDAVNYGQMQDYVANSRVWKETLLFSPQLKDGTDGGIAAANAVVLSANLQAGDTFTLNDGTSSESYVADTDFSIGASINDTLVNLAAVIEAAPIAASTTTDLLSTLDASNYIMVVWQDVIGSTIRIYGNAGAATRASILPTTALYEGEAGDLVALPTSDPSATNFGFYRNAVDLVAGETHYCRCNDSIYTWDADDQKWNLSGASSIPFASKDVYGKVMISDGINVSSGIISVDADGTTLTVSADGVKVTAGGISSNELGAQSVVAAKLGADVDGDGLTGGAGSPLAVLADGTTLSVSVAGVKVTDGGINQAQLAAGSVIASKLGDDIDGNGLTGGAGSALAVLADTVGGANLLTTINVSANGVAIKAATNPGLESDGTNALRVKVKTGGGIVRDADGLSVDAAAINAQYILQHTLTASDITSKSFTLDQPMASTNQIQLTVLGGVMQTYATDYTAADSTTVSWSGLGLDGVVVTGDLMSVTYPI